MSSLYQLCDVPTGSALRLRLIDSFVQPTSQIDLLIYKAIGSNYLSFVVTSMLVSTSPLDEAGTATIWFVSATSANCVDQQFALEKVSRRIVSSCSISITTRVSTKY